MTPIAACFVTVLAVVGGTNHRGGVSEGNADTAFYATVMLNNASRDAGSHHTFALSQISANLEWNSPPLVSLRATNPSAPLPASLTNMLSP